MAYWQRKNGKYITVFFIHPKSGKPKQVPRKITKHLDLRSDNEIEVWVEEWARLHEAHLARPDTAPLTPELSEAYSSFTAYVEKELERAPNTIANYKRWLNWAAHYFKELPMKDWPTISRGFGVWLLTERGVSESEVKSANRALLRFWRWAEDEDIVEGVLKVRGGKKKWQHTPLKHTITPDEALALAWRSHSPLGLIVLVGYFFSLRPQETFALTKSSFLAGKKVEELECGAVMKRHGLYSRLAVYVGKQKTEKGVVTPPKSFSKGWVSCFDERAARLIVTLLEGFDGFDKRPNRYYSAWRESGANLSLKDLRRASIYWLGHYTSLPPAAIKNHARHQSITTTEWYLRRPGEDDSGGDLSLDD